ncbi:MAG: DNA-formamidopyrimidine glycosylase family protein [Wenzhouxiangellaceae bacterium]|nr:DNA-formamidopyrimidine glycosylase family protein [Wenzhouxiangellaceae bacterium]
MPELPDVEVFKQYFDATALHRPVRRVCVENEQVLDQLTPQTLGRALKNRSFERSRRHGKYLFAEIESGEQLALHFGMTGALKYYQANDAAPEHARVRFDFANGSHLAFVNPRLFGRIRWIHEIGRFLIDHEIGPDALSLSHQQFREIVGASRAMAKSTLMDQSKMAGIGNIYSDEILFRAHVHPRTRASELNDAQLEKLFQCMRQILKTAIEKRAEPAQMPRSWLIQHRTDGDTCPVCDGTIKTLKMGSRTGFYCSSHQAQA